MRDLQQAWPRPAHPRPIVDCEGHVMGGINMLVDISERIRGEAELAVTKDQLADQVESLTALHNLAMRLGGISELAPALQAILALETRFR